MSNEETTNAEKASRLGSRRKRWLLAGGGLFCALLLGVAGFLQSTAFQQMARRRLVAALEQATGARVELDGFSLHLTRMQVDLRGLTLHGREGSEEPPLFSAQLLQVGWQIIPVWNWPIWNWRADLRQVRLWKPQIYVAVYENGQSNIPLPPRKTAGRGNIAERMLALQVKSLEVLRGQFRWNENRLPIHFQAENFRLALDREAGEGRYSGRIDFQNALLTSRNTAPLPSQARARFHINSQKTGEVSLQWRTLHSRLSAQGRMEDFRSPRFQFDYDLLLNLKEAAELRGSSGWQGEMAWRGQGSYDGQGWQLQGDLELHHVRTGMTALPHVPWSARSFLRLVRPPMPESEREGKPLPWRAEFQGVEVTALGGRITGEARVEMASPGPITNWDLQLHRVSLPGLAGVASALRAPVAQLRWVGAISGPLQASFVGMGKGLTLTSDWRVDAPPVAPPGFTPVSGILRGRFQAEPKRWESKGSYLQLPQSRLAADGWLSEEDSRLSVALITGSLEECRPLAELLGTRLADYPLRLYGQAQTELLWRGGTRNPTLQGNFELAEFGYENTRWEGFSGKVRYGRGFREGEVATPFSQASPGFAPHARFAEIRITSGKLRKGNGVVEFDAGLGLENGSFTLRSPFSIHAALRDVSLEDLQSIYGVRLPMRGIVRASLSASGTREDPRGQASVVLTAGEAYGETFDRLTAQVVLDSGGVFSAQQIHLQKGEAFLEGKAVLQATTKQYRFSLTGSDIPIESFRALQTPRFPVTGLAQVQLSGEGSFRQPRLQGKVEISKLVLGSEGEGNLTVGIETRNSRTRWQLTSSLLRGELQGSGEVLWEGLFPLSARLEFENMDVSPLLRPLRESPLAVEGRADGTVVIEGELRRLSKVRVLADLSSLSGTVGQMGFGNSRPLLLRYQNSVVELEQVHLTGKNLDMEARGTVGLSAEGALNLTAEGRVDLAALKILDPHLSSSGIVLLQAELKGTLEKPLWNVRLEFSEGDLRYGNLPNGLTNLKGTVVFEANRGSLENFSAESGGGRVQLGGLLTYGAETGFEMRLSAQATGVRVRYPEGISTLLDGQLSLTGTQESSLLAGQLVINKQTVSPRFDLAAALLSRREESRPPAEAGFLRNMRLDLRVVSAPDARLETTMARNLQAEVDLRVQGSLDHPTLLGRIGILQGEMFFGGTRYTVNRGEISFRNPFRIEPNLNLSVHTRVRQYDISLDFTGPTDRLNVTYRSDPPLSTRDILTLLTAGRSQETNLASNPATPVPEIGANTLLSTALRNQMGSRLDRIFGAGRIRVDPQIAGFNRAANANVGLEQQISDNLTILYVTNVTSTQQQIIQAEWTISPRLSVVAIRDQNGLFGVNFQIKLRFR